MLSIDLSMLNKGYNMLTFHASKFGVIVSVIENPPFCFQLKTLKDKYSIYAPNTLLDDMIL